MNKNIWRDFQIWISVLLTIHNVIILLKSVFNSNEKNYYYDTFVEKGSNEDKYYTQIF